uniref:RING finger and CHY zinc finger domain-containing protein 1 n=1 Tax=Ciona intestinalis TaxID=7719 RepID=F6RD37_CIOIN|nr:RING finger and CHY zinc finger domain-containing protein 1 [Ciona intestinalis]|eukprot:XP_002131327.1 RING finger and CHY zinc finger domain-containing protein 1 [Ciona intestinalis]
MGDSSSTPSESEHESENSDFSESENEVEKSDFQYGCSHYSRKCSFVSPCCGKIYTCRICHDDEITLHNLDRHSVKEIICSECKEKQFVSNKCRKCGIQFGKYFCSICNLYDDKEKGQFHCDGCGICRVGGKDNFFHCHTCGLCLPLEKREHKCVEKASRTNCPVCMEDLHTSRENAHIPHCGHLIHNSCYKKLLRMGDYRCPICGVSTVSMKNTWTMIDEEIANTPMPPEYADHKVWILCRDCQEVSEVKFHVLGLKCMKCNSYNTCGASAPETTTVK